MNDLTHQPQKTYVISGMDISAHICPNLDVFNHYLVSGIWDHKSREAINWSEQQFSNDPDMFLHQLSDSARNVFHDGEINTSQSGGASFSILIHNPFQANAVFNKIFTSGFSIEISKKLGIGTEQIKILACPLPNALRQAISILVAGSCENVALISPFRYGACNPDRSTFIGIGSLLFSREFASGKKYASLLIENNLDFTINENCQTILDFGKSQVEKFSKNQYTNFQQAPVIKLIRSVLELNFRSHFSLLPNDSNEEISSKDYPGAFIRPWFPSYGGNRTHVLVQGNSEKVSIEESVQPTHHSQGSINNFWHYLLPVPIDDLENGIQKIKQIISILSENGNLKEVARQYLREFGEQKAVNNVLVILGESRQDVINELERAQSGIAGSLESGKDWQTPSGSYFTPNPMGPDEKIAFVYPGAFSTYVGMGSEIFYLFPELYGKLQSITEDPATSINDSVVFPADAAPGEIEKRQGQLNNNPIQMITSGISFSFLYTAILQDIFKIDPDAAFGYSLGENSMMFAMGIWKQADAMRTSLEVSPVFHTRVSGPQMAIREFWNMPSADKNHSGPSIWANYVLMASPEKVNNAIKNEDRVYLTHINTPRQVVIGGEKNACQRVADAVKCMHLQAPYHHAIHCAPVRSEYDGFVRLHDWPVENSNTVPVYSAANYSPLEQDSRSIAHSFAKMLTNPIDFPHLINLAYHDGARIFIELGAGSNCSKWVDATLKGKPHAAFSINQNNVRDHISILRLLARLISHKVPVNLDPIRSM